MPTRPSLSVALCALLLVAASPRADAGLFERLRALFGGADDDAPADAAASLTQEQIGRGLREALRVGVTRVIGQLGTRDGFNLDPQVHIPLPYELDQARAALARVGLEGRLEDLEIQLNRAAEAATAEAGDLFVEAIREMTLEDVRAILAGPDDAATRYFRSSMGPALAARMTPVVDDSLEQVGAARLYEQTVGRYNRLPMVPQIEADLTSHVVGLGIDGIFQYLAREEALIRQDPAARSTELLETVFAAVSEGEMRRAPSGAGNDPPR